MDDEDHVWLEQVNNERQTADGCDPVTHDQLEGIIDRLEKESIFETNSKNKRDLDDTEAVCCVCNDGEVKSFLKLKEKNKNRKISVQQHESNHFLRSVQFGRASRVLRCALHSRGSVALSSLLLFSLSIC